MLKVLNAPNNKQVLKMPDGREVYCLYINAIPVSAPVKELVSFLSPYGEITKIFLKRVSDPLKKSTFALVTFAKAEEAFLLYSARSRLHFKGKKLFISIADAWHQPSSDTDGGVGCNNSASDNLESGLTSQRDDEEDEGAENLEDCHADVDVQHCPAAKLNDDCLLHIMEFIPFSQRHILSHVCRRWRNLMALYWSKITELNFYAKPFNEVGFCDKRLELYLRLCPNIRSVHLNVSAVFSSDSEELMTTQTIVKTASLCPRLEELTLMGIELTNRPLAAVAHSCRNLKSLYIKACRFKSNDCEMNSIMKRCVELENLKLQNCLLEPGLWLLNLRPGLKSISFLCCKLNQNHLTKGLKNVSETLEELNLIINKYEDPLDFSTLQNFSKLENVAYVSRSVKPQRTSVDMFKYLKTLELESNNFLTNELLKGIVEHSPNLTSLNIASSKNARLTSDGLKVVADLGQLVKVNLSENNVEDDVIIVLADKCKNLEALWINYCCDITDSSCKKVMQNLMKLRELHLEGCDNITNKTYKAAVEAATLNPDKAELTLFAADTGITEVQKKYHDKVKLFKLNKNELTFLLCGSHQDFSDWEYDDDDDDYEDDDEDLNFDDLYDEEDLYNYPYHSDDLYFDFIFDDIDGFNPLNYFFGD